jgi:hypothetical protein
MLMARGGQSMSTMSAIAPAALRVLALISRTTLAEPSRNWIRYCTLSGLLPVISEAFESRASPLLEGFSLIEVQDECQKAAYHKHDRD